MSSDVPVSDESRRRAVFAAVVALLIVSNVMSNRILPAWMYVPWNLTVAAACVWMASRVLDRRRLGLMNVRAGVRWGVALIVATLVVLLITVAIPAGRELFRDSRAQPGIAALLYHTLVRIPLGTVVLEEVAFRAVLPALVAVRHGVLRGSVVASILFGLWHVLPSIGLDERNQSAAHAFGHGPSATAAVVAFAVVATTAAGLAWCWLRYRSSSALTTVLAHIGTNSLAFTIAWFVR